MMLQAACTLYQQHIFQALALAISGSDFRYKINLGLSSELYCYISGLHVIASTDSAYRASPFHLQLPHRSIQQPYQLAWSASGPSQYGAHVAFPVDHQLSHIIQH